MTDNDNLGSKTDITFDLEFIQFYSEIRKTQTENVFILFNHGSFYTLHDNNAEYVSKNFLNTTESLKIFQTKDFHTVCYTWISQTRFSSLIRHLLIENNFAVEIYSKTNPKSNIKQWRLEIEASPGCLGPFENLLYDADVNISIQLLAVYIVDNDEDEDRNNHVSVVSIDPMACQIFIGHFQDNDCLRYLETILVRLNPKECFIPDSGSHSKKLTQLLKRNHVMIRKYSIQYQNDIVKLEKIFKNLAVPECREMIENFLQQTTGYTHEILCPLYPLLSKQKLLVDDVESLVDYPFGCFFINIINPKQFVRLDLSSIQHLHLFPSKLNSKSKQSLFQILNQCKTYCGMKLLEQFIRQPSTDRMTIQTRLDIVEFFLENSSIMDSIREQILPRIPDMTKLYKKLTAGHYQIKDVFQLYFILEYLRQLKIVFDNYDCPFPTIVQQVLINKLLKILTQTNQLYIRLVQALDLTSYAEHNEFKLNVKTFPELTEIHSMMEQLSKQVRDEHRSLQKKYDNGISLEQNSDLGWYYEVSKKNIDIINKSIVYQTISSKSEKSMKFFTRLLNEINDEFLDFAKQFEKLSKNCMRLLLKECQDDLYRISSIQSYISLLDILTSFAKVTADFPIPLKKPTILESDANEIELKQFRHPILESINGGQFVPNDIRFSESLKAFIITGPNMGGKSTLLRSVALSILMAQIGCFVPCESARISITDAIYTRMSSSDDLSLGMSTFMAEMCEIAGVLKSATSNSLILIDELGRSTSTNDGFGLAQSIIEHIARNIRAYTLFATHFHNLGSSLTKGLINRLHMESSFNEQKQLIIHYRALSDQQSQYNSQSFGIEVMKSVGMPEHIIHSAQDRLERIYDSTIDSKIFNEAMDLITDETDSSISNSIEKILNLV
uniref:DNA mismatch repair protein Msh2-like n=1 Tax=Dermatophagoides pteronyssinus TaxID=6956 RepID=A0A6P6XV18_DERPT|nr:DNA mismatch repair protein Msh2-like [Dermatophagoides pteronyssinus]